MKSTESAMTLNRGNGNLQTSTELLLANANGDVTPNNTNNHNDTNGSIIKMTMKNNHLIVETEERNVSVMQKASSVRVAANFSLLIRYKFTIHVTMMLLFACSSK